MRTIRRPGVSNRLPCLFVEIVVQDEGGALLRQALRVTAGASIRGVLVKAGHADAVTRIEASERGLALHGQRAWLDDPVLVSTRIEVMLPITADAKAWRRARVAERRARLNNARKRPV